MYACLIGRPPFETVNVKATYGRIRSLKYCFPEHLPISPQAQDLIQSILRQAPSTLPLLLLTTCTWLLSII